MEAFLQGGKKFRREKVKVFGITEQQLNEYYQIMKFCDRLSLILCKDQVPENGRKLEINNSINDETYYVSKNVEDRLIIEPWCFKDASFDLSVETRYVKQATFSSGAALKKALNKTEATLKDFKFKTSE